MGLKMKYKDVPKKIDSTMFDGGKDGSYGTQEEVKQYTLYTKEN